jgi:ketosteroid isomerase-like protein
MSQEHIERLREGYALINRKDFDAALALVHPDFRVGERPGGSARRIRLLRQGCREGILGGLPWQLQRLPPGAFRVP